MLAEKEADVRHATYERYRQGLDRLKRFIVNDEAPIAVVLTSKVIRRFKAHRLKEGAAPATVSNDLIAVSVLCTYAVEMGWIDERPKIRKHQQKTRVRWLDSGQLATYMAALRPRFRCQMELLVGTGMRLGESESLRACDLRLGEGENRALIESSKTDAGVRSVFVPSWVADALTTHIEEYGLSGTDPLFANPARGVVQREHSRACRVAGIEGHTIHDFRHCFAVYMARSGMPLHLLQNQLGHEHISTTMIYSVHHPDYSDVAGYFESVGKLLGLGAAQTTLSGGHFGGHPPVRGSRNGMLRR